MFSGFHPIGCSIGEGEGPIGFSSAPARASLSASVSERTTIVVLSDPHYAGAEERKRRGFQWRHLRHPLRRRLARAYYHHVWLRDPFAHNELLDRVIEQAGSADIVVANGDYSCDSAFVGVSDDAALASAEECVTRLRRAFGERLRLTIGDHELGKVWLFGGRGGLRLESWRRTVEKLHLRPFWSMDAGRHTLLGVTSSLIALAVFEAECLPEEWPEWQRLRDQHLAEVRAGFAALKPDRRIILFCHDPTALPFLWREPAVRERLSRLDATIIGHLHTPLVWWQSRLLAGMPEIKFLGRAAQRMSAGLREAKLWKPFKVRLCPSLAGVELLRDGGYLTIHLSGRDGEPPQIHSHRLRR